MSAHRASDASSPASDRRPAWEAAPPSAPSSLRVFAVFLVAFLSTCSGIIASSDGVTVFNVTAALVERGEVTVADGNTVVGSGGRQYSKYGLALSLLSIPFYLFGRLLGPLAPEQLRWLLLKGSVSLTNVVLGASASLLLLKTGQRLGYSARVSLQLAMAFAFTTFFAVNTTKSFLTHPLETLSLLGAIYHLLALRTAASTRPLVAAGAYAGLGVLTKLGFAVNLPVLVGYLLASSSRERRIRHLLAFALPLTFLVAIALAYNHARFGSIVKTGYQPAKALSGPLFVGLYGLLFSSGKSLFLYAPPAILGVASLRAFAERHRREAWLLMGLVAVNLLLIAKLQDWSGEGSWGPRYLTLVLPCLILPIGAKLATRSTGARGTFLALAAAGLLVQFGGLSVYYGTYYRTIGAFPYERDRSDPLFMSRVRYVPTYSPAWGQLRMAGHAWRLFLTGYRPELPVRSGHDRIPLAERDTIKLRDTLDLWFAYAFYAGAPFSVCLGAMVALFGTTAVMARSLSRRT
jgi:hypothetical protein